jgi:hypothetical protein
MGEQRAPPRGFLPSSARLYQSGPRLRDEKPTVFAHRIKEEPLYPALVQDNLSEARDAGNCLNGEYEQADNLVNGPSIAHVRNTTGAGEGAVVDGVPVDEMLLCESFLFGMNTVLPRASCTTLIVRRTNGFCIPLRII